MHIETLFATHPTVLNATYDKVWVEEIVISALSLTEDATARVRLRKFRSTESGGEFSPEPAEVLEVPGLLAAAGADPDLAAAIGAIMSYVAKVGAQRGVVSST